MVIIDTPPLLPVTDAAVLAALADGALLVTAVGSTRREQVRQAVQRLDTVGGRLLGLVANRAPSRGSDAYAYGYGYAAKGRQAPDEPAGRAAPAAEPYRPAGGPAGSRRTNGHGTATAAPTVVPTTTVTTPST